MKTKTLLPIFLLSAAVAVTMALPQTQAEEEKKPIQVLFTNVNIFDGFSDTLQTGMSVLVENNYIKEVAKTITKPEGAYVVDGGGRTMTPGLIDMHQHVMLNPPEGTASYQTRWDDAAGGAFAQHHLVNNMLLKGITTIRDIAGDPLDVAKAIDMGYLPGPRIYSSGGAISQVGGHGDWAGRNVPPELLTDKMDMTQRTQNSWSVTGPDEVTRAVRLNLRRGAAFTKVMGGGDQRIQRNLDVHLVIRAVNTSRIVDKIGVHRAISQGKFDSCPLGDAQIATFADHSRSHLGCVDSQMIVGPITGIGICFRTGLDVGTDPAVPDEV